MNHNTIYSQSRAVWGDKPNKLLQLIAEKLPPTGSSLDLGCGQGRDALWMAQRGYQVTAVDSSEVAITQLQETAKQRQLNTINTICSRVEDFTIASNQYNVINAYNILQFLMKPASLDLIRKFKETVRLNGFIIIAAFTVDDPMYQESNANRRAFFERNELKELFFDFQIIHSFEGIVSDKGHPGKPEPHTHGVVEIIAQRS